MPVTRTRKKALLKNKQNVARRKEKRNEKRRVANGINRAKVPALFAGYIQAVMKEDLKEVTLQDLQNYRETMNEINGIVSKLPYSSTEACLKAQDDFKKDVESKFKKPGTRAVKVFIILARYWKNAMPTDSEEDRNTRQTNACCELIPLISFYLFQA